jgi:hypothetical protein
MYRSSNASAGMRALSRQQTRDFADGLLAQDWNVWA